MLVGHSRGTTAAFDDGFRKFGNFCLRIQGDVAGNFGQSSATEAQGGSDFGEAIAVTVPRGRGKFEAKIFTEGPCHGGATIAKSGKGADCPAKLQRKSASAEFVQPNPVSQDCVEPSSDDETESSGKRLLHPGACHKGTVTMSFSKSRESIDKRAQVAID